MHVYKRIDKLSAYPKAFEERLTVEGLELVEGVS